MSTCDWMIESYDANHWCVIVFHRSTKTAFVKTNMVHKLHKMNKCGLMPLPEFKELLKPKDYAACERRPKPYVWYNLTSEVFIKFLNRVSFFPLLETMCILTCIHEMLVLKYLFASIRPRWRLPLRKEDVFTKRRLWLHFKLPTALLRPWIWRCRPALNPSSLISRSCHRLPIRRIPQPFWKRYVRVYSDGDFSNICGYLKLSGIIFVSIVANMKL